MSKEGLSPNIEDKKVKNGLDMDSPEMKHLLGDESEAAPPPTPEELKQQSDNLREKIAQQDALDKAEAERIAEQIKLMDADIAEDGLEELEPLEDDKKVIHDIGDQVALHQEISDKANQEWVNSEKGLLVADWMAEVNDVLDGIKGNDGAVKNIELFMKNSFSSDAFVEEHKDWPKKDMDELITALLNSKMVKEGLLKSVEKPKKQVDFKQLHETAKKIGENQKKKGLLNRILGR
jgi:hypothetical protein